MGPLRRRGVARVPPRGHPPGLSRPTSLTWFESAEIASSKAYDGPGISVNDIDFAEVYAPCSIVELILSESIGLFPKGTGGIAAAGGATTIGGQVPISTSGGCASRGHPRSSPRSTTSTRRSSSFAARRGTRQVENATIGAVTGELGDYNATMMHILASSKAPEREKTTMHHHDAKTLAYPPRMTEFTTVFWDGLREGVLRTTRSAPSAPT